MSLASEPFWQYLAQALRHLIEALLGLLRWVERAEHSARC